MNITDVSALSYVAQQSMVEYLSLLSPCWPPIIEIDNDLPHILGALNTTCCMASDSVLYLVQGGYLWGGEIIIRSVIEGTVKYVFICDGNKEEVKKKIKEYWGDLPTINLVKRHKRIKTLFSWLPDSYADNLEALEQCLLEPAELEEINNMYPKNVRKELERNWSFGNMIRSLADSGVATNKGFIGLAHSYGIGSHVIHQDADSLNIIFEREERNSERKESMKLAHASRLISEVLHYTVLRVVTTYRLSGLDTKPIIEMIESHEPLYSALKDLGENWWNIEKEYW